MKKGIILVTIFLSCSIASGQVVQTAYFLDDFTYSYRLNPALHPGRNFVGLPMLGSFSANYRGDFAIGDILYKRGGRVVTFMDSDVSTTGFLGKFKRGLNKFSSEAGTNVLAVGFEAGGMYNILDVNLRTYASGKLPYDMVRFLKEGTSTEGTFDMSGLHARSTSFAEIGITSSWRPRLKLKVGMRLKGVIGLVNSYIDMDKLEVTHAGDSWTVDSEGVIASAYDGYDIKATPFGLIDFRNTQVRKPRGLMNGFGVGADVGFFFDDGSWHFSGSLSDIGCIFWFHNLYGHAPSVTRTYMADYSGLGQGRGVRKGFSDMGEMLADALGFVMEDENQSLGLLPLTARFGAKYLYYSDLSFGGLATFRYDAICPYWDVRGNVQFRLSKMVDLACSLGAGSLGVTIGAIANVRLGCLDFFAGTDNLIGGYGPGGIPTGKRTPNFATGLNIIW